MVPGKALFFLVSLFFLIFVYCTHCTFGADHDYSQGGNLLVRRLSPGAELTDPEIALLSKVFHLDSAFIKERYTYRYATAVAEVSRGNFAPLAAIVAELTGTLNENQLNSLLQTMGKEKEEELKKTPPDPRFVSFLDQFLLAAQRRLDPAFAPQSEDGTQFLAAFDGEYKKIQDSNDRFKEKLAQAVAGNRQAKDFIKSNYDSRALPSFLDAQGLSGNKEMARNLARALDEADDSGNHSIDLIGPKGAKERLSIGTSDADIDNALGRFSSEQGFGGRTFSPQRHAQVDQTFQYPRSDNGGTPVHKKPGPEKPGTSVTPLERDKDTQPPRPPTVSKPATLAAFALIKANCVTCHGPGKKQEKAFAMKADGSPNLDGTTLAEAMDRMLTRALVDEDMPLKGPLSQTQKDVLKSWANEQGVPIPK